MGSLIATTANIHDQDFLNGIHRFTSDGVGNITNNTLVTENGISNTWNIGGSDNGSFTNVLNISSIQNLNGGDSGNN